MCIRDSYLPYYTNQNYTIVFNAAGGVRTRILCYIAHMRRCPYTRVYRAKRSKYMFSRSTIPYHRGGIYKYPICQNPLNPKDPKSSSSTVRDGTSAKRIFTSFCAVYTRIWTPTHMGYIAYYARTYAASSIPYYGITLVNIRW